MQKPKTRHTYKSRLIRRIFELDEQLTVLDGTWQRPSLVKLGKMPEVELEQLGVGMAARIEKLKAK